MKAEKRKGIETNSLILALQRWRQHASGRTLYYVIGTIALIAAIVLLWRYFSTESKHARDAILFQLQSADTVEKLEAGMEEHRGTIWGSVFKMHLARYRLRIEGLPRLGTDRSEAKSQAAASVTKARDYFLALTKELKEQDEPALVQEAWYSAGEAEEALVGLPTQKGGSDSRGDADKAIQYFDKAGSIFPDTEFSQGYKARADKLRASKDQFVAAQRAIHKEREQPPPVKTQDPPKADPKVTPPMVPPAPMLPPIPAPPDPKAKDADPKKGPTPADPKAGDTPKPPDPKPADPKAK
jgi:hypothetical protein